MAHTALLDANVLHPMVLCDLLIRLSLAGCYRVLWSEEILSEMTRSVLRRRPDITPDRMARRVSLMNEALPDAMVVGYGRVITTVAEFGSDAHVVAAAIVGRANVIVTQNLGDFPAPALRRHGLEAESPDRFLVRQWWMDPVLVAHVVVQQAQSTRRPALSPRDVLDRLRPIVPEFVQLVEESHDFSEALIR